MHQDIQKDRQEDLKNLGRTRDLDRQASAQRWSPGKERVMWWHLSSPAVYL